MTESQFPPEAQVQAAIKLPAQYTIEPTPPYRIIRLELQRNGTVIPIPVAQQGMVIRAIAQRSDGTQFVELAIVDLTRPTAVWQAHMLAFETLQDVKAIGVLAKYGLIFNRTEAMRYFAEFYAHNAPYFPKQPCHDQFGWVGDDPRNDEGFVLGDTLHTVTKHADGKRSLNATPTQFLDTSDGTQQLAQGFETRGSMQDWWGALEDDLPHWPAVEIALMASFAPPLLSIFNLPNFIVDIAGRTSGGKTTALAVAASVWGNPDPRARNSLIQSWNTTEVGLERVAATLNCLPLLVDETKQARQSNGVNLAPTIAYQLTNGCSRVRGQKVGLQRKAQWRTVVISTGEDCITDLGKQGGLKARVVPLWGSPFENDLSKIPAMMSVLQKNYGHAGVAWVRQLVGDVSNSAMRNTWWAAHQELEKKYTQMLQPLGQELFRIAGYLATLSFTRAMVNSALHLNLTHEDPVLGLIRKLGEREDTSEEFEDRTLEALRCVLGYIDANPALVYRRYDDTMDYFDSPPNGWFGFQLDPDGALFLFPQRLRDILAKEKFAGNSEVRNWNDRGWIESNMGRARYNQAIAVSTVCTVKIRSETIAKYAPKHVDKIALVK